MSLISRLFNNNSQEVERLQQEVSTLKHDYDALKDQQTLEKAIKIATTSSENFRFNEFDERSIIRQIYTSDARPSGISNEMLRTLSFRSTILSSIIARRRSQISCFGYRQRSKLDLGWRIVPKDSDKEITPAIKRDIDKLSEAIENLGFEGYDPIRGSFKQFIELFTQDSLTFDGAAIEFIRNRQGIPIAWKIIDGAAIHPRWDQENNKFVYDEYIDGAVNQTFEDGIIYCVRNKTTDRNWMGYGVSETERTINTITSHLFAEEYNKRLFKSSHFLSGVVSLKGQISREQLGEFKRDFYSFLTGVENTNRVAIVNAPQGIEILNSLKSPSEMGFSSFMDYLLKVLCAAFLMDPVEVNFFITGGSGAQSNPTSMSAQEFRLKYSKDAGLRPLLAFIEDTINKNFVSQWDERYELRFFGLDVDSKKERQSHLILSKKYRTLNEVRREEGLPDIEGPLGNVIEDSGYMQVMMAQLKDQQASQQGQEQGAPAIDQENLDIISAWMTDNGYSDEDIATVVQSYTSGELTFDNFLEYTGVSSEDLEKYRQKKENEDTPDDETPKVDVPKIEEPKVEEPENPAVIDHSKDAKDEEQQEEEQEENKNKED